MFNNIVLNLSDLPLSGINGYGHKFFKVLWKKMPAKRI
jgi:hypothetical protein